MALDKEEAEGYFLFHRDITETDPLRVLIVNSKIQSRTETYQWEGYNDKTEVSFTEEVSIFTYKPWIEEFDPDVVVLTHKRDALTNFEMTPRHLKNCADFFREYVQGYVIPLLIVSSEYDLAQSAEIHEFSPRIASRIITLRCSDRDCTPNADKEYVSSLISLLIEGESLERAADYARASAQCHIVSFEYRPTISF
jgi:hypothetical protein